MEKQRKSFAGSRGDAVRNWCVRTGKRFGRYQRSYSNGNKLFRPRHPINLRHRCGGWAHRRR